jgi:hypothetical protein
MNFDRPGSPRLNDLCRVIMVAYGEMYRIGKVKDKARNE